MWCRLIQNPLCNSKIGRLRVLLLFALRRAGGRRGGHRRQRHCQCQQKCVHQTRQRRPIRSTLMLSPISRAANCRCSYRGIITLAFFAAFASHRSSIASVFSGKFNPQFTPIPSPGHIYTTRRRRLENFLAAAKQNFHLRAGWQRLQAYRYSIRCGSRPKSARSIPSKSLFRDDCDQRQRKARRIAPVGHYVAHGKLLILFGLP